MKWMVGSVERFARSKTGNVLIYIVGILLGSIMILDMSWNECREVQFFYVTDINNNLISGYTPLGDEILHSKDPSLFKLDREYLVEIRGFDNFLFYKEISIER